MADSRAADLFQHVVIVGAGPVGLTAGLALGRHGFDVTILEELELPSSEWRASTFHPPTLDVARVLGVVEPMLAQGLICRTYQVRDRTDGLLAEFDYALLDGETDYPFRLQLEQYKYVQILTDALCELPNVRLVRGRRVHDLEQFDGGVVLEADGSAGKSTHEADFVVAADGARSAVRHALGVSLDGETYEHRYLVLSLDAPLEELVPGVCDVNYVADPDEHLLLLRIPDLWRVIFSVPSGVSEAEATSRAYVAKRLELLTSHDLHAHIRATQVYNVHQRVAERFVDGRVALIGDAAHINSPMGGMGLNSGIHDAYDLAETLASLAVDGPMSELERWAERRRRVALDDVRRITHDNTSKLAEKHPEERANWHRELARIANDPVRSKQWLLEASMIASARRHKGAPLPSVGSAGSRQELAPDNSLAPDSMAGTTPAL